jgi:short-subunit dehydrogenase
MVDLNVNSTGRMTYLVLEGMTKRKRGAIVNMSSSAARGPTPLLAQYSGTKGYDRLAQRDAARWSRPAQVH